MYSCKIIRILESGFYDEISQSIDVCKDTLTKYGYLFTGSVDVDPVMSDLKEAIYAGSRSNDLVIVLGGTGLYKEDIGPEAVLSLVDKRATGIEMAMMRNAVVIDPSLSLYRVAAGTIIESLILCIPGYHTTVMHYLEPVIDVLKSLFDGWRGVVSAKQN
jgi:molybdopterin biosynthesis enzyme MoaB